ncbi:hypothetical protein SEPCBS119000_005385 [Sporothrix epigloea]|uniref:5'-deoxynucleotidase n=1 Tax=Sporothrix epigloea TaxID=1892477 RepID=A0ABP0DXB9_9PEZI
MGDSSQLEPHGSTVNAEQLIAELGFVPTPKVEGHWTVEKAVEAVASSGTCSAGSTAASFSSPSSSSSSSSSSPLAYFHLLELLKTTKREGWRRFGITQGESIADHMYRMSLISMVAPPALAARLDMNRCIKMCLVHDMAESLVGDITPVDGVAKPEKSRREATTMDYITGTLLGGEENRAAGAELRALWQEYEDAETAESHFVHDVDKMELLLQMYEYEKRGQGHVDLGEFAYVATKMALPETRAWAAELLREREAFWASKGKAPNGQPSLA